MADNQNAFQTNLSPGGAMELPQDWHLLEDSPEFVQNPADALAQSLIHKGRVDIDYMANLCRRSRENVIADLGGAIWQNPDTWEENLLTGWETADQYLSGPLSPKLAKAREAAIKWPALFTRNVLALEAVMPHPIEFKDIHIDLGSPWLPPEVINEFANQIFKAYFDDEIVSHDPISGEWKVNRYASARGWYGNTRALFNTYGGPRCNGLALLEKTLNRTEIKNALLREKQEKLKKRFQKWLKENPQISDQLRDIYDARFGFVRKRTYDGSFLKFPGMTSEISLYPHQRNAVARILFSGNTLLAHKVGAGKTFTMIAAAMEMKRLGKSAKNIFIVPNNVVGQWQDAFQQLYPDSRVLVVQGPDFTPKKRLATLTAIRDGNYDGIIMAYSCADRIPLSLTYRIDCLEKEMIAIESQAPDEYDPEYERRVKKIGREIEKLIPDAHIPEEFCFDKLGVTGFFLDESHNYKNIPLDTRLGYLRGINVTGSKKCADMLARSDAVQKAGGIVVLATGTPVCNSISDVYTNQRFLQNGTLELLGIKSFADWAGNFAEIGEALELDVDGSRFRGVNRFTMFYNLPELSAIFNMVADYADEIAWDGVAKCEQPEDMRIPPTPELTAYVRHLAERADRVRGSGNDPAKDNMLKICTDGRKAALDMHLVDPMAPEGYCKAVCCAKKMAEIWREYSDDRSAQVIFCDLSVPKKGFNIYGKLKKLLVAEGIPAKEIAFVHDCETPAQKKQLYENVRKGLVRVVIGSTFKLGLGVNIQDRLIALHHLDAPWRPADMEQREGRILRKGNKHEFALIFRYVTEGSFDAYCWQILETKQRFIASFLSGKLSGRHAEEMDAHVLSYAEVKALALGDPLIKNRVECCAQIEKNIFLQKEWEKERENMRLEAVASLEKIAAMEKRLALLKLDQEIAKAHPDTLEGEAKKTLGNFLLQSMDAGTGGEIETRICQHRGFEIFLRASPAEGKKGLWLEGNASTFVEMGKSGAGCVTRLDNAIKGIPAAMKKLEEEMRQLRQRRKDLAEELEDPDPYAPKLAKLNRKLKKLDKELGER